MVLLLIFLFLKTGAVEARTSIVYGVSDDPMNICESALPLTEKLYRSGKFDDGPKPELLKKVTGRCEPVDDKQKLVRE